MQRRKKSENIDYDDMQNEKYIETKERYISQKKDEESEGYNSHHNYKTEKEEKSIDAETMMMKEKPRHKQGL